MDTIPKNSIKTFFSQIVCFFSALLFLIILARVLGPADQGIYTLLILIPTAILQLGIFSLDDATVYFTACRKYELKRIVGNSLAIAFVFGILEVIFFAVIMNFPGPRNIFQIDRLNPAYLQIVLLTVPFLLLFAFLSAIALGREAIGTYNKANILQSLAQLAAAAVFLLVLRWGLLGAIISYFFSIVVATGYLVVSVIRVNGFAAALSARFFADAFKYGMKAYFGNVAQFLTYRLNVFLVAYFLNPAAVGIYNISVSMAERLWIVPKPVALVLFPRVASIDQAKANELTPRICRHVFFALFAVSAGLAAVAKWLIALLFGAAYASALVPFLWLLPGVIALGGTRILTADLAGRGRPEIGTLAAVFSLIFGTALNLLLIPRLGLVGAALATSSAYILSTVIVTAFFSRVTKISVFELLILKKSDINDYWRLIRRILSKFGDIRLADKSSS